MPGHQSLWHTAHPHSIGTKALQGPQLCNCFQIGPPHHGVCTLHWKVIVLIRMARELRMKLWPYLLHIYSSLLRRPGRQSAIERAVQGAAGEETGTESLVIWATERVLGIR